MCLCFISSPSLWLCWQKKIHKTKSSEQILGTVWLADQVKRAKPMTNLISRLGTGSTVVMFHLNQLSTTFNRQYLAGGFKPSQNSCHSYIIVPNGIRKQGFMKSKEHYWRYRTYYVFFLPLYNNFRKFSQCHQLSNRACSTFESSSPLKSWASHDHGNNHRPMAQFPPWRRSPGYRVATHWIWPAHRDCRDTTSVDR